MLAAVGRPPSAARAAALEVLLRSAVRSAPGVEDLIEEQRRKLPLSPADIGLARELVGGVLRNREWLEHLLTRYLERPLPNGARAVHESLILGIYQSVYLDRVPPHAIVDDAVRLCALHRTEKSYQGLTNAILRKVTRQDRASMLPGNTVSWPMKYSIPEWIASDAGESLEGIDLEDFFASQNIPAALQLRAVGKLTAEEVDHLAERIASEASFLAGFPVEVLRGKYLRECFEIRGGGFQPEKLPSFRSGQVTVMDEAAQIAVQLAGVTPGQKVLDGCASPGGKTAALWDAMNRTGSLTALDVSESKLVRLKDTLRRLRAIDDVKIGVTTELFHTLERDSFDCVVVDAPCSGLGTMRRHPEIRWRRRSIDVADLAETQARLLEAHAPLVRVGGHLIYAVCTFTREEGTRQVARFLARHGEFTPAEPPASLSFDPSVLQVAPGVWRTLTHRDGCDCFVVARMRRIG